MLDRLDATAARRWAVVTRAAFAARRTEIDALNVFPVPDGDTGTNLYLTLDAGLDAVRSGLEEEGRLGEPTLEEECARLAGAMLLTARGNSGVILSQLVRGFAEGVGERTDGGGLADAAATAYALTRASERAWASLTRPVEGTILSVARASAERAVAVADEGGDLAAVCTAAVDGATEALALTTSQLPALELAGVVDAGGAGFLLLVESLERVVRDDQGMAVSRDAFSDPSLRRRPGWGPARAAVLPTNDADRRAADAAAHPPGGAGSPGYEVMYLLDGSDEERVATLRGALEPLGDSLLVVGGPDIWNVHVHVDDVGAAIEAGIAAGRPYRIRVTHFADQVAAPSPPRGVAVVACASGPGLATVFEAAGAIVVHSGPGPGHRASAGQLLEAARSARAASVIMLPNDADTRLAAEAASSAAAQDGLEVRVVRSRTAVQGLAAVAVFDPEASAADNVVAMSSASAATRHGAVTVATREALTSGGTCRPGDILGVIGGDVAIVGGALLEVAGEVASRLLSSGGELVTLVLGIDAPAELGIEIARLLRLGRRDVEVSVIHGGQPVYSLLVGVE